MDNRIDRVKEFHEVFVHPINEIGTEDLKTRQLRVKLLFEELQELSVASDVRKTFSELCSKNVDDTFVDGNNVDFVEELDSLCDLDYVLNGKILTGGYHNIFEESSKCVHESNMSKTCKNISEAEDTIKHYINKDSSLSGLLKPYYVRDGVYIVKRDDGKILKNIYYKAATVGLIDIINKTTK
jgi:predicted HAD superfamily Cof-like phosphohydrolase